MADAKAKHQKARDEFSLYVAWQTAALGRVKEFPQDFDRWIHPPKPPTPEEVEAARRRMAQIPDKL